MDRPALKRLLGDIGASKVDGVVVYKRVGTLTRAKDIRPHSPGAVAGFLDTMTAGGFWAIVEGDGGGSESWPGGHRAHACNALRAPNVSGLIT
jgi:hypothetical protein